MKKIIFILVMAVSAIAFTGCCPKCKDCPPEPLPKPESASKIVKYHVTIIDDASSEIKYYIYFNDNTTRYPITLTDGSFNSTYNLTYSPSTSTDSLKILIFGERGGAVTNLIYYVEPLEWTQCNIDGILYKSEIHQGKGATAGGPGNRQPVPIGITGGGTNVP